MNPFWQITYVYIHFGHAPHSIWPEGWLLCAANPQVKALLELKLWPHSSTYLCIQYNPDFFPLSSNKDFCNSILSCWVFDLTSPSRRHLYVFPHLQIHLAPNSMLSHFLFLAPRVSPSNLHPSIIYLSVSFPAPWGIDSMKDLSGCRTGGLRRCACPSAQTAPLKIHAY